MYGASRATDGVLGGTLDAVLVCWAIEVGEDRDGEA